MGALGKGVVLQSLGCGSTAPTTGPRFLFSAPISECVCIILKIDYPTATMTPLLTGVGAGEQGHSSFPLFFVLLTCDPTSVRMLSQAFGGSDLLASTVDGLPM